MKLNHWIEAGKFLPPDDLSVFVVYINKKSEPERIRKVITVYQSPHSAWLGIPLRGYDVLRWKLLSVAVYREVYDIQEITPELAQSMIAEFAGRGDHELITTTNLLINDEQAFDEYFQNALNKTKVIHLAAEHYAGLLCAGEIMKEYFAKKIYEKKNS